MKPANIQFKINCNYSASISRSVALPRNALVRLSLTSSRMFAPFLCAYRFGESCVSGGGATQLGEQLITKKIQILLNVALHVQLRFATNHASSLILPESTAHCSKQSQSFSQQLNQQWQKFPLKAPDQS